jgi:hypothetical protein
LSLLALPRLVGFIEHEVFAHGQFTTEKAIDLVAEAPPRLMSELDETFHAWARTHFDTDRGGEWCLFSFPEEVEARLLMPSAQFIVRHEYAHWHLNRFNLAARSRILDRTTMYLSHFVATRSSHIPGVEIYPTLTEASKSDWIEKISCDTMSLMGLLGLYRLPQERRELFAGIAMVYGILNYWSYFYERFFEEPMRFDSHPPTRFREGAMCFIVAEEHGISEREFLSCQYGAGIMVGDFMGAILNKYKPIY